MYERMAKSNWPITAETGICRIGTVAAMFGWHQKKINYSRVENEASKVIRRVEDRHCDMKPN
jgi:hypothetical protein